MHLVDIGSIATMFAAFMSWVPNMAALLTVAWLGARLYNELMTIVYRRREHYNNLVQLEKALRKDMADQGLMLRGIPPTK